jgi:hypothetical protein
MPLPVWLIESGVYGSEIEPLAAEIQRQGMDCRFVAYRDIVRGPAPLPPGECAIVYGSYPTVRHAILHRGWHPGGWCNPDHLDCTTYYPHFENFLLNQHREIITGVGAIRDKRRLFAEFGNEGYVFARPTSLHKLFVGRLISENDFEAALAPTRYDPESRVVIAHPREIGREWRLVIARDEVVAGSQYAESGVKSVSPHCREEVYAFARAMLDEVRWRPDELFMLDIAEADGRLHLVELNSFSCSWLYACDFARVVAAASEAASRRWQQATHR